MARNERIDQLHGCTITLDGAYYRADLPESCAHDLWLWPAYARAPHEAIPSANQRGRSIIRVDDRDADGAAILQRIEIVRRPPGSPLAAALLAARRAAALTQAEAGDLAGVPQPNLSNYERGTRTPGLGVLRRLADAYGTTVSELTTDV